MRATHVLGLWLAAMGAAAFPQQSFRSQNFTVPDMAIVTNGAPLNPGEFYLTADGAPLIISDENELIWRGSDVNAENVKLTHLNGERVLGYWQGYQDSFGHGYGQVSIFDNRYSLIKIFCLPSTEVFVTPTTVSGVKCYLDRHESFITKYGTLLVTAVNVTNYDLSKLGGPSDGWVFDNIFYEIDIQTAEVLFRWSALENIDPLDSQYIGSPADPLNINGVVYGSDQATPWDWFQLNSAQPFYGTGDYIISSRTLWSIYRISGDNGRVLWTLQGGNGGDFKLKDPAAKFSWQFDARAHRTSGNTLKLHMFVNDNYPGIDQGNKISRGLWLEMNEDSKRVKVKQTFIDESLPLYSLTDGSYQHLPAMKHVLLYYGDQPVVKEFNSSGGVVYTAQFGDISDPSEGNTGTHAYRAYKQAGWSATPYYRPSVVAYYPKGKTALTATDVEIYASWNGATKNAYNSWNIWGGTSLDLLGLKLLGNKRRKGFETKIVMPLGGLLGIGKLTHIAVEASMGGTGIKNSSVIEILTQ